MITGSQKALMLIVLVGFVVAIYMMANTWEGVGEPAISTNNRAIPILGSSLTDVKVKRLGGSGGRPGATIGIKKTGNGKPSV